MRGSTSEAWLYAMSSQYQKASTFVCFRTSAVMAMMASARSSIIRSTNDGSS